MASKISVDYAQKLSHLPNAEAFDGLTAQQTKQIWCLRFISVKDQLAARLEPIEKKIVETRSRKQRSYYQILAVREEIGSLMEKDFNNEVARKLADVSQKLIGAEKNWEDNDVIHANAWLEKKRILEALRDLEQSILIVDEDIEQ